MRGPSSFTNGSFCSFSYAADGQSAVEHVNLKVDAGKMTAVVGTSGAGKSTLTDLLIGLIGPQKGEVLIDGIPLDAQRLEAWRSRIAARIISAMSLTS
jgi:ABC-type bacteriocin/lantibiotic exporter with double-glycine peptidase domain